jgi:hypothetical protein
LFDNSIECVEIRNSTIVSRNNMQSMLSAGIEELFVVDLDAIFRNKFNFRVYQDISKFFEITVMSLPLRIEDIMDSFVSGASEIVIPGRIDPKLLQDYVRTSDNLVMYYQNPLVAKAFYALGGRSFFTDRELDFSGIKVYSYSKILDKKGYIRLMDFPREELEGILV